ncbi:murein hydrolase activator EnvC family protein [Paenibacillus tarimensis]|uniref:murein hydrolase activator EnvC family protein n=1 Tax=Paenibacillus tarimensis TaxID=416012 RepID=UPI001F4438A8|nr:M23 family metallopeptidase [Paenibacillus tarimensis]MCF2944090.1 peptidoglycan DD-metalloendopeptidase family protein [Paenibacillus tarimensis]
MKRAFLLIAFIVLAAVVFQPVEGEAASELDKIRNQIDRLKKEMNQTENTKQQIEENKQVVSVQKEQTLESINAVMSQIDQISADMQSVTDQIAATEAELLKAGQELVDAEARIEARDELLQSRVRLMYTSGFVSYLDVLMSSNSFSDFLDRFDALQSILNQDKEILEEHKRDKELILAKKSEVEVKLGDVKKLYDKQEKYYNHLVAKEKEKEKMILQYNAQLKDLEEKSEELEDISEEQESMLIELAKKEKAEIEKQQKKKNKVYYSGGKLALPVRDNYRMSSNFGPRIDPITGQRGKMHNGIDFSAPQGTAIYAAEAGTVIVSQSWSGYGNCIIIDHGNGLWTLYGHIRSGGLLVSKGETVKRDQKIAEVGSTGRSTGPHLHFEVRLNEQPVNPISYLKKN